MMPDIQESAHIRGVRFVDLEAHPDERGEFLETFRKSWFPERDWDEIQTNRSVSNKNVLRGIHYHLHQVDYWIPMSGRIRVGLVDLRTGSPTAGGGEILEIGGDHPRGILVPPGVGHGFLAVTEAVLVYLVDRYYDPDDEHGVAWDDPDLDLDWGTSSPVLSPRDQKNPKLREIPLDRLPRWGE